MPSNAEIIAAFPGYATMDPNAIQADFAATGGQGKGGGSTGTGGIPSFNFDFAAEAEKAYGELGLYYDRILRESKGDTNLALSRLTEDYERGKRIRREDLPIQQESLSLQRKQRIDNLRNSQSRRGILSDSVYDPSGGRGLADEETREAELPFDRSSESLLRNFTRQEEQDTITKGRTETDLRTRQEREEADMEQRRRKEAAELSNIRGERAYRNFSASLI